MNSRQVTALVTAARALGERLREACCAQMREDGYCAECNPLGGSYAAVRAEIEAERAAGLLPRASRSRRIAHEGRYGVRYRRPRMDRRRRK